MFADHFPGDAPESSVPSKYLAIGPGIALASFAAPGHSFRNFECLCLIGLSRRPLLLMQTASLVTIMEFMQDLNRVLIVVSI